MEEQKSLALRMMFLIVTPKLAVKAEQMFREGNIPIQYQFRAQGTATSEIMNMLGFDGVDKTILLSFMPKAFADVLLEKLRKRLYLDLPNSGIAYTVPMSGASSRMIKLVSELQPEGKDKILKRSEAEMSESEYSMVMAIVDQGFSEEVMEAARPAGATGGSVFHCRRIGSEEAKHFWGISVQPEREIIIILARKADKLSIMQAIGNQCGMKSEAHGVVFSMPIDGIVGLE